MSDEEKKFVELWNTCNSAIEVATKLGKSTSSTSGLAASLRKRGIELKKMKPGRRKKVVPNGGAEANGAESLAVVA